MTTNRHPQVNHLILFGRYPMPGLTKTRLIPALGPIGAAEFQRRLTEKTLKTSKAFAQGRAVGLDFYFEGGDARKMSQWLGSKWTFSEQESGNLGERMHAAFMKSFHSGSQKVVLIGTDIPGLSVSILEQAFDALNDHDVVIGPSTDGGYGLISMKSPHNLFEGIDWGTESVLEQTMALARKEKMKVHLLDPLTDIDTLEDLKALPPDWRPEGPYLSIIIPTLNEEVVIEATLDRAHDREVEIIVADGGSTDNTIALAKATGARVVRAPRGRAHQQNRGAELAEGRILLFLHADTLLPKNYLGAVFEAMMDTTLGAGAFRFQTDLQTPLMRLVEFVTNIRSTYFKMPYGDQAIFIRKSLFESLGGFPNMPIMEDFVLMRRIKKKGGIMTLPLSVVTSGRRWVNLGVVKTTLINQAIIAAYLVGVSPAKIALLYKNNKEGRS
ncbi:MAG: TIGR04283 family arsenosugar biosynthesis glycosyltransferase [Thermodesulfobacteriota bacterium]|nr:TIGR04283 family arsenosugar biosynthesis glycosyltransferase [Thermodesulfobacteriota bacterium]